MYFIVLHPSETNKRKKTSNKYRRLTRCLLVAPLVLGHLPVVALLVLRSLLVPAVSLLLRHRGPCDASSRRNLSDVLPALTVLVAVVLEEVEESGQRTLRSSRVLKGVVMKLSIRTLYQHYFLSERNNKRLTFVGFPRFLAGAAGAAPMPGRSAAAWGPATG